MLCCFAGQLSLCVPPSSSPQHCPSSPSSMLSPIIHRRHCHPPPSPVHCLIVVFFYCPRHCRRRHPSSVIIIMSPHPLSHPLFPPPSCSLPSTVDCCFVVIACRCPPLSSSSSARAAPSSLIAGTPPSLLVVAHPRPRGEIVLPPRRRVAGASRTRHTPTLA